MNSGLFRSIISGLFGKYVLCFLDDVFIASKDSQGHYSVLSPVILRFESAGSKVQLSKCDFLGKQIKIFGDKVDKNGIHTLDCKVQAIQSLPTSSSPDQIRQFLGLTGFYRQFIQNFSLIAQPFSQLPKKNAEFLWSEKEENAFNHIKSALCSAPVLAFPNFEKEFSLCTDVVGYGLGAVLMAEDDNGKFRVIAYTIRLLNKAELNYDMTTCGNVSVIWSLRHFRDLILG